MNNINDLQPDYETNSLKRALESARSEDTLRKELAKLLADVENGLSTYRIIQRLKELT
jgi:DNA invertase Pin-like site-specific DNA recombinase